MNEAQSNKTLFNKEFTVPEVNTRYFDNSDEYVVIKKTRKGLVKVIKPEILEEIKGRIDLDV